MFKFIASLHKKLFFGAVTPIVIKARTEIISEGDLLPLPKSLDPLQSQTFDRLKFAGRPYQFLMGLFPVYIKHIKWGYLGLFIAMIGSLASPNLIHLFIERIQSGADLTGNLQIAALLAFCGVISGIGLQYYFFFCLRSYQSITNDLNRNIFLQSLDLSVGARAKAQVGDIVNHMSSDSESVSDISIIVGDLLWAIVMVTVVSGMLFFYIGWSALAALAVLSLLIPFTQFVAKKFIRLEEQMMHYRDNRVTLMSQILSSIRVVKYFAWESAVEKEVGEVRAKELGSRRKLARAEVISGISYVGVGTIVLFVALYVHVLRGFELDAALIFTCIALFGLLEEPFGQLSRIFSRISQALVSAKRIQEFLSKEKVIKLKYAQPQDAKNAIELRAADFYYDMAEMPALKKITLSVEKGHSLAIVGPVGAGKSTLLHALLGEIKQSHGTMALDTAQFEKLSYVPQEAYIVNSTLLENVSFGVTGFSKESLRKSIHAACLDKDIKELPAGLRTEIGEKGVNLSGGQKQRVSLARAAMVDPDIVFLDDPLSAVDVETERNICSRLLFGLWKNKTRLVVTHRLESLKLFDHVVFVKDGQIESQGPLGELLEKSESFKKFYLQAELGVHQAPAEMKIDNEVAEAHEPETDSSRITEDEEREKGAVKSTVYFDYIKSLGGAGKYKKIIIALLAIGAVCATGLPLLQKWWLSYFSNHKETMNSSQAILIYGALGVVVLLAIMTNQLYWLSRGIAAGKNMHDNMLKSILGAQIRFFDSTPVGRILQRFSRDLESVDVYLQWSFESFIHCVLQITISLVLILVVLPMMVFVIVPVFWLYYKLQNDYRRPAREAKRLDSIARSPRYAHFKETLQGLVVIRAFRRQDWFFQEFYQKLFHSQTVFHSHYMINRWFSSRIPIFGGLISLATLWGISFAIESGALTAGVAGLVTIYSLSFWGTLNWGIRIFADIESRMTSIERLKFYSQLPQESNAVSVQMDPLWPKSGTVEFKDVRVRYAEHLPLVLKSISFSIRSGEKVGIIGRTGSGKTTLFQTLYRFIQPEAGQILVDGQDVSEVALDKYRRVLSIVPQDPTLFVGTLRKNLDRYDEYSDPQIEVALAKAGLLNFVKNELPGGLHAPITENGTNLSQGQRQLLCLARALLVESKIVLMDEATASVDVQTDALIQKVIRESLKDVTMIIIAHRLVTVSDCDQIIEMSDGEIKNVIKNTGHKELDLDKSTLL